MVLRLCIAEGDRRLLLKTLRAADAKATGRAKALKCVYYDTRRGKLRRAGYHLSIHAQGRRRIQLIELAGSGSIVSEPPCWARSSAGDAPTPESVAGTPLETVLDDRTFGKLKPVFALDLRRGDSVVERDGAVILARLDSGGIAAGGFTQGVCELRLERVTGTPDALFELARELSAKVPTALALRSHGEKGFELLRAQADHPGGEPAGDLHEGMTAREAADTTCRTAAIAIIDSFAQLRSGAGQDALHRGRIALRRLRAILWFLEPILDPEARLLSGRLRSLTQLLGGARELDVFCEGVLAPLRQDNPDAPGMDALVEAFAQRRREAYAKIVGFGQSPATLEFGLDLVRSLAALASPVSGSAEHALLRESPVGAFAQDRLDRCLRRFLKESRHLKRCDPERQHDIRVRAKKLRYAIEAFSPVIGPKTSGKLLGPLTRMQDALGDLNDARTGHDIALAYARERTGDGQGEQILFAAGLAAAACAIDPGAMLAKASAARGELAKPRR
jgi:triphosphatase